MQTGELTEVDHKSPQLYQFRPAILSFLALTSMLQPAASGICPRPALLREGRQKHGLPESYFPIPAWPLGLYQWPREPEPG